MYSTHFYCLVVEAVFYSDVVECLPLDPATCVRFPAGTGRIYLLFDMDKNVMKLTLFEILTHLAYRANGNKL